MHQPSTYCKVSETPNSQLTSFGDEAGNFLNLRKHNQHEKKILFYTP